MKANISQKHSEHLAAFRISPELLEAARVESLTDSQTRELLGINGQYPGCDLSGLAFPFFDPLTDARTGVRVRIDAPIAESVPKYLMETSCKHLFFAPGSSALLDDTSVSAIFVEAEKSALALAALAARSGRRYLIVATGGANAWKRKREKKLMPDGSSKAVTGPSPDFDLISMKGRHALVAFDSNVLTKPTVRKGRAALQKELVARKASVAFVEIPLEDNVNGPDDYIRERGDEAMLEAIDKARGEAETLRRLVTDAQGNQKARSPTPSQCCAIRRRGPGRSLTTSSPPASSRASRRRMGNRPIQGGRTPTMCMSPTGFSATAWRSTRGLRPKRCRRSRKKTDSTR
jgi:hypothetical protein